MQQPIEHRTQEAEPELGSTPLLLLAVETRGRSGGEVWSHVRARPRGLASMCDTFIVWFFGVVSSAYFYFSRGVEPSSGSASLGSFASRLQGVIRSSSGFLEFMLLQVSATYSSFTSSGLPRSACPSLFLVDLAE